MDTTRLMQQLADAIVAEARARIPRGRGRAGMVITVERVGPSSCTIAAQPQAPVAVTPGGGTRLVRSAAAGSRRRAHTPKGGSLSRPASLGQDVLSAGWQSPAAQSLAGDLADSLVASSATGATWQAPPHSGGRGPFPDLL
jgi:hypothetical protein